MSNDRMYEEERKRNNEGEFKTPSERQLIDKFQTAINNAEFYKIELEKRGVEVLFDIGKQRINYKLKRKQY